MEHNEIVSYIRSLYPIYEGTVQLHEPLFIGNEIKYVTGAIDSTFVSSVGKYVNLFEEMMVQITGAKYAVALVNGTSALHISLLLAGVKRNEEVLSQPLTFVATANAISYIGATPHFVDVDEDTMGLSPVSLTARLKEIAEMRNGQCFNKVTNKRIAACVPMHTFGLPLRIDEIVEICNEFNIPVIEDAAESLGSFYKDIHTGTFGLMGTFSFNGNKTITSGGGGAIVTNDQKLAHQAKHLTTTAKVPHKWEYAHDHIGYNYRMPNLNAALACAQLEQLDRFVENKRETANTYRMFFSEAKNIHFATEISRAKSNYWLNAIQFDTEKEKLDFLEYTNSSGVMTRPIWNLMNNLQMYSNCPKGDLKMSESLAKTVVNIPSSVRL